MCLPALGLAAGMGGLVQGLQVVSAIGGVVAQAAAANAQEQANQRQYQNTMQAYRANIAQTNLQQQQEAEASAQKIFDNNIKARAAASRAQTASGESGVSGLSVDSLMQDIVFDQGRYNSSVETNFRRAEGAIQNQRENVYANAASQINSLKTPEMPNYFTAGLQIAQAFNK